MTAAGKAEIIRNIDVKIKGLRAGIEGTKTLPKVQAYLKRQLIAVRKERARMMKAATT